MPKHVSNTLHADDFAVWCAEEHTTTAVHRIQNTINKVCSWTERWALQLNTTKTVSTLFALWTTKEKVSLKLNNQPVSQVETPTFLGVTLDIRLTWKLHLEVVEAKATRKLAIMKKLAGTTWRGGNSDILKQVYTGAVRPVIKYASKTWDTASKTNKSKLDRVQNMGLRITLGAVRSTPIQQMEKTADLQPLECRHEYKAAIQREKLKRLTSHPLHQKLQHGAKNRLKRKSFKHKLKDLHLHLQLHLGFVHPLQDVALHQCLPLSSVCCFPNPGCSLLLCYVILPSSAWSSSRPLPSPWLPLCAALCPPIVL